MRDAQGIRLQHRTCALKHRCIAANHDRKLAVFRPFYAAGNRRIEEVRTDSRQARSSLFGRVGGHGRMIDHDGPGAQMRRQRLHRIEHICIGGDT
jgi:hypothetical protein